MSLKNKNSLSSFSSLKIILNLQISNLKQKTLSSIFLLLLFIDKRERESERERETREREERGSKEVKESGCHGLFYHDQLLLQKIVSMLLGGSKKGGRLPQHKIPSVSCPTGQNLDSVFVLIVPFVLNLG